MGLAVQKTLFEHFGETPEWRRVTGNFRHGMREVLTVAFLAQAGGARSVRQIAVWAKENEGRLRDAGLGLPYGVPSRQCLDRVFRKMPPAILRALERRWSTGLRNLEAGSVLAVDGKALKHASADGVHTPYVVSAWACDGGFVVGETKTAEKSNEITAIPELLDDIAADIRGCVVTIDAAGCQKNIARKVVDVCRADYVFGLKGNQKNLHDDFLELFDTCQKAYPDRFRAFATVEKNGGRHEERKCVQTDFVEWFPEVGEWKGLRSVIMVEEHRITNKGPSHDRRLYASSLPLDAERALGCVRKHWGVENGLHWTLDVIFREDDCRSRAENAAENLATFRHLLVGVLRQKGKELGLSVGGVAFKGVCSREFAFSLVFGDAA